MHNQVKNTTDVGITNQRMVLNVMRSGLISRTEIARLTGLTKASVTKITERLIKSRFIEEAGKESTARGRYPEMLTLSNKSLYAVGADISRNGCTIGVSDFTGSHVTNVIVDIKGLKAPEASKVIAEAINAHLRELKLGRDSLLGLGISIPGPVDALNREIINPPNFNNWHYFHIGDEFDRLLGLPTRVENDATAYALAENLYGFGKNYKHYLVLVLYDGVGSALITDGKPFKGQRGLISELGHVSVDLSGERCECGNYDCLELYASEHRVIKRAVEQGLDVSTWEELVELYLGGNETARGLITHTGRTLAFSINNFNNIFYPEAVIITGKIQYKPELLLETIQSELSGRYFSLGMPKPDVLMSRLEGNKTIIASTSIIINEFI